MRGVEAAGWPPSFAHVRRAVGGRFAELGVGAARARRALRPRAVALRLEPEATVYVGHGRPATTTEEKRCARVGENFGLPHRDFAYGDAHWRKDGRAKVLNTWLPFTYADADNGCLWVVPKEFDERYSDDSHYDHSRPALPGFEAGTTKLRFPIGAARPVALGAGHVVCWHNVVHWGGSAAPEPRRRCAPLAATFRRPDAPKTHLVADDASLDDVLDLRSSQTTPPALVDPADRLARYRRPHVRHWYDLDCGALPAAFLTPRRRRDHRKGHRRAARTGSSSTRAAACLYHAQLDENKLGT